MTKKFFKTKTLFKEIFLRVRNTRNRIFHSSAVVYFSRPENCAALPVKLRNLFELTHNLLLNNTFNTYQLLKRVLTGPWNCPNIAKLHLKSASSIFNFYS